MSSSEYEMKKFLKAQIKQIENYEKEVKGYYRECRNNADNPFSTIGLRTSWYAQAMKYSSELDNLNKQKMDCYERLAKI